MGMEFYNTHLVMFGCDSVNPIISANAVLLCV